MIVIILIAVLMVAQGLRSKAGYLHVPTLVAILFITWFVPQLLELGSDDTVPASGYTRLVIMAGGSLIAFWIGWYSTAATVSAYPSTDLRRLLPAAIGITLLSIGVNLLLNAYRPQMNGIQQWTGPITILAFFAQVRDIALALSLILFLRHRNRLTFVILLANLLVSIPIAFSLLRRAEIAGFGVSIICAFWFTRRQRLSLPILVMGILAFAVVVYTIGPLRGAARAIELTTGARPYLFDPSLWKNIDIAVVAKGSASKAVDLRNALYLIDYYADSFSYKLGGRIWNGFVQLYIPGQIVGQGFKDALFFERASAYQDIQAIYNFRYVDGTTPTGLGAAFSDFGYLGVGYFFIMAKIMKRIFDRAEAGSIWSQISYMCFLPLVLLSMTHGHEKFFVSIPFLICVIWIVRTFAKYRIVCRADPKRRRGFVGTTNPTHFGALRQRQD